MEQDVLYIHRKPGMSLDQFLYYILNSLHAYIKNFSKTPSKIHLDHDDYFDIYNNKPNVLMFDNNTAYILTIEIDYENRNRIRDNIF